ncbi:MAG: hypothetical protein V4510_08320 [bacterium]
MNWAAPVDWVGGRLVRPRLRLVVVAAAIAVAVVISLDTFAERFAPGGQTDTEWAVRERWEGWLNLVKAIPATLAAGWLGGLVGLLAWRLRRAWTCRGMERAATGWLANGRITKSRWMAFKQALPGAPSPRAIGAWSLGSAAAFLLVIGGFNMSSNGKACPNAAVRPVMCDAWGDVADMMHAWGRVALVVGASLAAYVVAAAIAGRHDFGPGIRTEFERLATEASGPAI